MTPEREEKLRNVIKHRQHNLTLVLENIWDPHNVSAILRTADSVGILEVYLVYTNQTFPELGKKSSAGSRKWMKLNRFSSVETCYEELRSKGFTILATHLGSQSKCLFDLNLCLPTAFVLGNEHSGVSEKAHQLADANFQIPQIGFVRSLNVSVAAAVSLYEAFRQRRGNLEIMSISEQKKVLDRWSEHHNFL